MFKMEIGLNEVYFKRLHRLHDKCGGSNTGISEVIELALKRGIDELLNDGKKLTHQKKGKKK